MSEFPRYTAASVEAQIDAVLAAWGMPEDKRRVTAGIMVETDLRGIDSHGISMLIMYEQMHRAGQVRFDAEPSIVRQTATTALVDGHAGLGHPVSAMAMRLAVDKALAHDVGVVSVRRANGAVVKPADELMLAGGDTLVLAGAPERLALAEAKLLALR